MNILLIHQNFPAQLRHLAPALAATGHQVVALTVNPPGESRERLGSGLTFQHPTKHATLAKWLDR